MKLKKILTLVLIVFLILSLGILTIINKPVQKQNDQSTDEIVAVGQGINIDLSIKAEDITAPPEAAVLDNITINAKFSNKGTSQANEVLVVSYIEQNGNRTEINRQFFIDVITNIPKEFSFKWLIPADFEAGDYNLIINVIDQFTSSDLNLGDNEAIKPIKINSLKVIEISILGTYTYPGRSIEITATLFERLKDINTTLTFYYYPISGDKLNSQEIGEINVTGTSWEAGADSKSVNITWDIDKDLSPEEYIIWVKISNSSNIDYINAFDTTYFELTNEPDTSKTPVYLQLWFIVGLIALIIFFLTIILSLIGVIPQDRLPIQPALVVMALVIMIIALIGNYFDPSVHLIGPQDIAGMVIIHPITALTAGFLVAGGLEAAGAFTAAADALGRIEKLQFKGKTIFGFTGTVVILTNIPTLIAMPCGRILGAALMPAALFFGYRVAKSTGDARMVGVVVFPFIVNAAASCGPSPLGGIGTIGEGLSKMPIGSFTTAQSTGIMICTGVCALFMRFITPMRPADLTDEDIKREMEANQKVASDEIEDTQSDPMKNLESGSKNEVNKSDNDSAIKNKLDKKT